MARSPHPSVVIVVGGAPHWQQDLYAAKMLYDAPIMGINSMMLKIPECQWGCTIHREDVPKYEHRACILWAPPEAGGIVPGADAALPYTWHGGSSSLYAVEVLRNLEYNKIILCGCPMDGGPSVSSGVPIKNVIGTRRAWNKHAPKFKENVRSMSGWTQFMFGAPTEEWLTH